MNKNLRQTILSAICALPAFAFAHASFEVKEVTPNSTYKAVIRIPHGCGDKATVAVSVSLPEGAIKAKPMPKAGWELEVVSGEFANQYEYHGKTVTAGPKTITWKGGNLPSDYYDEFVFRVRITDAFKPGTTVYFPVVQTCSEGENAWVEIPADGQDPHELKGPAPGLKIIEPHHDHAHHSH